MAIERAGTFQATLPLLLWSSQTALWSSSCPAPPRAAVFADRAHDKEGSPQTSAVKGSSAYL